MRTDESSCIRPHPSTRGSCLLFFESSCSRYPSCCCLLSYFLVRDAYARVYSRAKLCKTECVECRCHDGDRRRDHRRTIRLPKYRVVLDSSSTVSTGGGPQEAQLRGCARTSWSPGENDPLQKLTIFASMSRRGIGSMLRAHERLAREDIMTWCGT